MGVDALMWKPLITGQNECFLSSTVWMTSLHDLREPAVNST